MIGFGGYFASLFSHSVELTEQSLETTTDYITKLTADFGTFIFPLSPFSYNLYIVGGTNMLLPLKSIFSTTNAGKTKTLFILTDGEIENQGAVLELIRYNSSTCCAYVFGIGSSVDKEMVKGIARAGTFSTFCRSFRCSKC